MKSGLAFLRQHVAPAVLCFGLWLGLAQTDWLERIENLTLDLRTRMRTWSQPAADPRVVVIGIDDDSIERFGRWPWARRRHGELMQALGAAPEFPSVVGWDILFVDPSPDDDTLVAGALTMPGKVVFAAYSSEEPPVAEAAANELAPDLSQPIARIEGDVSRLYTAKHALLPVVPFRSVALTAFVDTPAGPDGVRRVAPLLVRVNGKVFPSLALQTVLRHWELTVADVRVRAGDAIYIEGPKVTRRIPIDETGGFFVNYRHATKGFELHGHAKTTILASQKYLLKQEPKLPPPNLGGKILLIGQVSTGLTDLGPTPLAGETPLVMVHANIVDNILREDYARRAPSWIVWSAALAIGVLGAVGVARRSMQAIAFFSLGVPVLFLAGAMTLWWKASLAVPVVAPLLGFVSLQVFVIARRVIEEQRAKAEIKGMFGTYVSPALVERMVESGQKPRLGGHEENITAYFSDIQSFSTFSEKLPADRLVELMNEYLTACTDLVTEEGGTLDKYIGDAVVAMFGAPIALPDHAYRACVAARRVHVKLAALREKWRSEGDKWPEIVWKMQTRIGLNSGPAIIGNMGSRTRFNYTMMGDNVNLAARMESGAKQWGTYTLCTEATERACEQHGGDRVVFRPLGRIVVMGRSQPVPIFEVVGLKDEVSSTTRECLGLFEAALGKYYARDWAGAIAGFERSAPLEPNQPGTTPGVKLNPSLVYLRIAQEYRATPPPENWEGVYVMKEK